MHFFDDILEPAQVASILIMGPDYTGTFIGERPLQDSFSARSCMLLRKLNQKPLSVDITLKRLGLTVSARR
jgi:hypothetical protein